MTHCWRIVEIPNNTDGLTDLEIVQLYTLVSHGSAPFHRVIATKLKKVAKIADHNLKSIHTWEDEGGRCVNGNENDNGTSSHHTEQNTELSYIYGSTPCSG